LISFPNAKINIGLYITGRRDDGYHNLESNFYHVKCCDALEIVPADSLSFSATGIPVPGDVSDNLCLKAWHLLHKDFSSIKPLSIHLHKMIPMGAGLGGGSADGAFMIKMLNTYFELGLSVNQQQNYAAQLGSDCAFFIENKPAFVSGRGEVIEPISLNLNGWFLVLVFPGIHVSTQVAFSNVKPKPAPLNLRDIQSLPLSEWKSNVHNQFEDSVFEKHQEIALIKQTLYNSGAVYASMSGSGSSVYGFFESDPNEINLDFKSEFRVIKL
jgi:4-diphosphocytidyl-2-C-methyl-D-erythritol kinase